MPSTSRGAAAAFVELGEPADSSASCARGRGRRGAPRSARKGRRSSATPRRRARTARQLAGLRRVLGRQLEPAEPELDHREVPERVGGHALVPLAPVRVVALEERPRPVELADQTRTCATVKSVVRARLARRRRARRLLGELERPRLAAVELDQREPAERRRRRAALRRRAPRRGRQPRERAPPRLEALAKADVEAQPLVDRRPQRRRCARLQQRLASAAIGGRHVLRDSASRPSASARSGPGCAATARPRAREPARPRRREVRAPRRRCAGVEVGAVLRGVSRTACSPSSAATSARPARPPPRPPPRAAPRARRPARRSRAPGDARARADPRRRLPGDACTRLPLRDGETLVEHRGEQRVRESHRAAGELDHAAVERRLERVLLDPRAGELRRRQARVRGREHERLVRRRR